MTHRLHKNERAVEHKRDDRSERKLRRAEGRPGRADREIRHDHCEDCQRGEHGQSSACSLHLETLLVMSHTTRQQAQADDAIANDHDHRENGVSCEARFIGRNTKHDRDDQRDFYDCDGEGENKRAERLSDPVRHHLGVVDRGENGGNEHRPRHDGRGTGRTEHYRYDHDREGQGGPSPCPPRRSCHF